MQKNLSFQEAELSDFRFHVRVCCNFFVKKQKKIAIKFVNYRSCVNFAVVIEICWRNLWKNCLLVAAMFYCKQYTFLIY